MRFTVKAKLATAFGAIVALSIAAGGVAYVKLAAMNESIDYLSNKAAHQLELAEEIKAHALLAVSLEKSNVIAPSTEDAKKYAAAVDKEFDDTTAIANDLYSNLNDENKKLLDTIRT